MLNDQIRVTFNFDLSCQKDTLLPYIERGQCTPDMFV